MAVCVCVHFFSPHKGVSLKYCPHTKPDLSINRAALHVVETGKSSATFLYKVISYLASHFSVSSSHFYFCCTPLAVALVLVLSAS